MSWFSNVFIAIDELGNAIAGGNPHSTISARAGYFAVEGPTRCRRCWRILEDVIDTTFEPIDGPKHCYNTYLAEGSLKQVEGSDFFRGLLGVLIIAACIPLAVIVRIMAFAYPRAVRGT